jgi:two-component system response regulator
LSQQQIEILLVEDDPNDLKLTLHALREEHLANQILIARDGEEALDFLFCRGSFRDRDPNSLPKLVLLDLKLPKVDGLEVLEQVRQNDRTRALPVVILTSSRQEEDIVRSYSLGVNSFVQKPVEFDQFQAAVKRLGYYWLLVNQAAPQALNRQVREKGLSGN